MIRPNPLLQVYVAEKTAANLVVAAHRHPRPQPRESHSGKSATTFFNSLLAASRLPCTSKSELRYQLAAGVVLNAWIENERRLGYVQRKKFYAFKERIGDLVKWAEDAQLP